MNIHADELEEYGRCWIRRALSEPDLAELEGVIEAQGRPGVRLRGNAAGGDILGSDSKTTELADGVLPGSRPVRLVAFNKSPSANWALPWHQDRVIAVASRHDIDGFDLWSQKSGVWHVEPPIELLASMIFARVHFDDADESNGCLELALGTHAHGRISSARAADVAAQSSVEICRARRGDVLFVKALTLHRSRSSQSDSNRRALRIDYSNQALPAPLEWALGPFV